MIAMEDYAIILDYLPLGYIREGHSTFKRKPVAQAIGKTEFTLLELSPKPDEDIEIHEDVYIGSGKREKVSRVNRRLKHEDLTATSRVELQYVIEEIVHAEEEKYVHFFNDSGPISTRLHQLELLPGIGKKHMWDIIKAREEKPFESFDDIKSRVPMLSDPAKLLVKRVLIELDAEPATRGKKKYILFTRPPTRRKQI